jgi:hypothetical protein
LPARVAEWAGRVVGDLVIGVPTRDIAIGFSLDHPALDELRAQVAEDSRSGPNGLYDHLLIYRNGALARLV